MKNFILNSCIFYFGIFSLLPVFSFSQQVNVTTGDYGQIIFDDLNKNSEIRMTNTATSPIITVTPDTLFPESRVFCTVSFPLDFDLSSIKFFNFWVLYFDSINPPGSTYYTLSRYQKSIYVYKKMIDFSKRELKFTIGGLKSKTKYLIKGTYFFLNCGGDGFGETAFETNPEPQNRIKKLLLVIDKEYENDSEINLALENYINYNKHFHKNLNFEKYYLEPIPSKKQTLYLKIKTDYLNQENPLRYLFFIGSNSGENLRKKELDPFSNQILNEYFNLSMNFYAQVDLPEFTYNPSTGTFDSIRYPMCNSDDPINDISDNVFQSYSYDLAYGSIMPNGLIDKKTSILNYFQKLNQFNRGEFSFRKSVLFADTFYNDGILTDSLTHINSRWFQNDTINVPQKLQYGLNNSGLYPLWTQDYLNKLGENSYEICIYGGHGAPDYHFFDISGDEILNLTNLNTMIFDFYACNTGNFKINKYVAGIYLEKGKTMFVKAYTVPMALSHNPENNNSDFLNFFRKEDVYDNIDRNMFLGDSFFYGIGGVTAQILLGDPLLIIDPPCTKTSIQIASPRDDNFYQNALYLKNSIFSSNIISEYQNIMFNAGNEILLKPGFETNIGSTFSAKINGCDF